MSFALLCIRLPRGWLCILLLALALGAITGCESVAPPAPTLAEPAPLETMPEETTTAGGADFNTTQGQARADGVLPQDLANAATAADRPREMSPPELMLWNDPTFQQRFIQSYTSETDIEPPATPQERALMQAVLGMMSNNQIDQAAWTLEQEIYRNRGCSALIDFTLGNIYFQQDRTELAGMAYGVAVEKYPKFRRAWKNMGVMHARTANFQKAVDALTKVIELGGADATTYGLLGYSYSSLDNHLSAESAFRIAILLDPATLDWSMGLARSFFKQERYPEAVTLLGQLLTKYPDRADLWSLQASAYVGLKQPLKAAENYKAIEALGKATPENLYSLGDIYITEQLYAPAAESYLKALRMDPTGNPDRLLRSARLLAARGALADARKLSQQVREAQGANLDVNQRKELLKIEARIAVADGASEEEVRVLEEVIKLDPLDGEALILLGQNSVRNNEPQKALLYFERAGNIEAFEADAKVRQAQVLVQQSKYAEAIPLLRRAQQVKPRDNIQEFLEQVERFAKGK